MCLRGQSSRVAKSSSSEEAGAEFKFHGVEARPSIKLLNMSKPLVPVHKIRRVSIYEDELISKAQC